MEDTLRIKKDRIDADSALFARGVNGQIQDELVIVIGSKGSGSSTVLNILAGKEIEIFRLSGKRVVDTVRKDYVGDIHAEGFGKLAIAHARDSVASRFPNCVNVQGTQFWEVPSCDYQDADESIANALYVHTLLRHAADRNGCKFVVVQDHEGVYVDGGKSFMQSLRLICMAFQPESSENYAEIIDAVTFIFNKVPDYVYDAEFTPELYLSNIIAELTTKQSEEELRKQPFEKRACAEFIRELSRKVEQTRHVEIPRAIAGMTNVNNVTAPVVEGLFEKVASSSCFVGRPVIPYMGNANLAVRAFAVTLRQQVQKCCNSLAVLLKDVWVVYESREGRRRVGGRIKTLLRALTTTRAQVQDGGVSVHQKCSELLGELEEYREHTNSSYLEVLQEMKDIIQQASTEMLNTDEACGEYFTLIASSIIDSAAKYHNESRVSELHRHGNKIDEYMKAKNRAWWNGLLEIIQGSLLCFKGAVQVAVKTRDRDTALDDIDRGLTLITGASFTPTEPVPSLPEQQIPAL